MAKAKDHEHVIRKTADKGTHVVCNQPEPCKAAKKTQETIDKGKTENRSKGFKRAN